MTGGTISLSFSASQAPYATEHRLRNFPMHSGIYSNICSRSRAVIGEMVDILALVLQHDEQAVLLAVEMALEAGVPTKTHVLNLLHRLVDGKSLTPPTISAPQALTLTNEPKANVERYDALRKALEVRHAS